MVVDYVFEEEYGLEVLEGYLDVSFKGVYFGDGMFLGLTDAGG